MALTDLPWYNTLRYRLVPPVFLVFFTLVAQGLTLWGNPDSKAPLFNLGSPFAWKFVLASYAWALASLKIPSKIFKGPQSPEGFVPTYSANGTQYYLVSLSAFALLMNRMPWLPGAIYDDFGYIISAYNISALVFCLYLMAKGIRELGNDSDSNESRKLPWPYLFYRGVQRHPTFAGADVKQFAISRLGMLAWALLPIVFTIVDLQRNVGSADYPGSVAGSGINAILVNLYLLKFFYWETGYFNTIDITMDRGGYYLVWGCLVWVPVFFTFVPYYLIAYPSYCSVWKAAGIIALGIGATILEYEVDRQKELFRTTGGNCKIWGKPAKFLAVEYKDFNGKTKKSNLLTSGCWGITRHMNYTFEVVIDLSLCLPAACSMPVAWPPFLFFAFMFILMVHRIFRDEEKCRNKYGEGWKKYCALVKYRLVPGLF